MYNRKISDKLYYERNKEAILKQQSEYYFKRKQEDPEWFESERIRKRKLSRDYHNKKGREHDLRRKLTIIQHYGPVCKCCGISKHEFLALDHIDGKGNQHRRDIGIKGGKHFYDWIIKNNFPVGFQILCHNCNFAKDHFLQGCPHNRKSD